MDAQGIDVAVALPVDRAVRAVPARAHPSESADACRCLQRVDRRATAPRAAAGIFGAGILPLADVDAAAEQR